MVELSKTFELLDVLATPEEAARIADISRRVEILTAAKSLDINDSDKIFMLDTAGGFTVTLPSIAEAGLGWRCKLVAKTAPTTAYIVTEKATHDTNKMIVNGINSLAGDAGVKSAACTQVNFVANQAIVGDWVDVFCDGVNLYVTGLASIAAGITVT